MLSKNQLLEECRCSLILNVLQNVNFLVHALHCLVVAFIFEYALLVPEAILSKAAAAAGKEEPSCPVLRKEVVKFATRAHCLLKLIGSLLPVINRWLTFIGHGRRRVDHSNDRIVELKVFVGSNYEAKSGPDDATHATNQSKNDIYGLNRPFYVRNATRLHTNDL